MPRLRSARARAVEIATHLLRCRVRFWHECDLRAAPTNVRSWESNGLNADVAFGPFMTHSHMG
jgi:hypothetical protein